MGITSSTKKINIDRIDCEGTLKVTLGLSAAPDITENPTDIVLILDRSGSMAGSPLANMKAGAKTFIDIIEKSTDGVEDGVIGSGSRIGIVSFASTATQNTQLITSVADLKTAIDGLNAGGLTNHEDAFVKALELFDPNSQNARVLVMFTDGKTTTGGNPNTITTQAKNAGVIIYCIGLIGDDGIDVNTLNGWASDPASSYVLVTPDDADLEELFAELAANISNPGATNIVIDEVINSDFSILSVNPPDKGSAMIMNPTTIQWKISELGVTENEGATLEFFIRHIAQTSGEKFVNESITYTDNEGNNVVFPDPSVFVNCDIVVKPEECPIPVDFTIEGCEDSVVVDLGDTYLQSLGRIVQLDVTIKNVCPNKRVALAAILTEVDLNGMEHQRGMKTVTIPAHEAPTCRDVLVKCIKFVLPDDLDPDLDSRDTLCNPRKFKARFIANNIDTDYACCESNIVITR